MVGKYTTAVEHVFDVFDSPVSCAKCRRKTLALFDAVCSRCAGVWSAAERAATEAAMRRPFPAEQKFRWSPPRKEDKMAEVEMLLEALSTKDRPDAV